MDQNTVVTILTAFVPIAGLVGIGFAIYHDEEDAERLLGLLETLA